MKTYAAIAAEIARLQAHAEQLRMAEKQGVIGRIREAIQVYGITAAELGLGPRGAGRGARTAPAAGAGNGMLRTGVAKYRDPKSGKTWTGRGKPPLWIVGAKDRDAFLIERQDVTPSAPEANGAVSSRRRTAKARPAVGVPKYRDPATGKTWTGRGKPPAWIAGARNREPFLISGESAAAA